VTYELYVHQKIADGELAIAQGRTRASAIPLETWTSSMPTRRS
jgi:hypothetical protein